MAFENGTNFDALLSTTLANYRDKLTDNVFTARPLTYWLSSRDRIRMETGGTKIVEQLIYGQNSTVGAYSQWDTISLAPQEGITAAEYDWKQYAASIAISGIEEAKNNGEHAIINLLESKIMQAEESIREGFNEMFFSAPTGANDWNGLGNIVDNVVALGGIDPDISGNEYWASYVDNAGGSDYGLELIDMATAYNSTSVGNDHPDVILTTQTLFEKYESLLQPQLRYTDTKTADAGIQNLLFKSAPIMYDVHCNAKTMYFLNSKYLKLVGHSDKWFAQTDFVRPENQDARFALILSYGNLVCSNRKKQGKLTNRTAASNA